MIGVDLGKNRVMVRCTSGLGHFQSKRPCRARVLCSSLAPPAAGTRPEWVSLKPSLSSGRLHLLSLVRSTRASQDCSDRILAEPDMAADQPVAQTSLCQLEDLRRLAVRWTLSWLAAEPLTAGLGGGDAGLDALADKVPLELGERRHHRGDHLAVRRRQVELQA